MQMPSLNVSYVFVSYSCLRYVNVLRQIDLIINLIMDIIPLGGLNG